LFYYISYLFLIAKIITMGNDIARGIEISEFNNEEDQLSKEPKGKYDTTMNVVKNIFSKDQFKDIDEQLQSF